MAPAHGAAAREASSAACERFLSAQRTPMERLELHKFRVALGEVDQAEKASGMATPARIGILATGVLVPLVEWGSPDSPPLVLLHDIGGCAASCHSLGGRLGLMGFHVIAPELRGHGRAEWQPQWAEENFSPEAAAKAQAEQGEKGASTDAATGATAAASAAAAVGAAVRAEANSKQLAASNASRLAAVARGGDFGGDFSLEAMVLDLLEVVNCLRLNDVDAFDGSVSKPWQLVGIGMGAAIGAAFAAAHPKRVQACALLDYDYTWPAERLCYSPYQALPPSPLDAVAQLIDHHWRCNGNLKAMARHFVAGCKAADKETACFLLDDAFLLGGYTAARGRRELLAAGRGAHLLLLHAYEPDMPIGRADAIGAELREAGLPSVASGSVRVELDGGFETDVDVAILKRLHKFLTAAVANGPPSPPPTTDGEAAADASDAADADALPPPKALSDALRELRDAGGDLGALSALATSDRTALTVELKGLGFRGMKRRVHIEKELLALGA